MKKFAVLWFAVLLGIPVLAAPAGQSGQSDTVVEEIIARVNNNIITRADLSRAREQMLSDMRQQEPNATPVEQHHREKDLPSDLIGQRRLLQKGEELGMDADIEV